MCRAQWRVTAATFTLAAASAASLAAWTVTGLDSLLPTALNDIGQVVGVSGIDGPAATWSGGAVTLIESPDGPACPFAVSSTGLVAGVVFDATWQPSAAVWDSAGVLDLGLGAGSAAWGVSPGGTVVGDAGSRPFAWYRGKAMQLPLPAGATGGVAYGIAGKYIVGSAYFDDGHRAVLWTRKGPEKRGRWTLKAVSGKLSTGRSVNSLGVAAIELGLPGQPGLPATWRGGDPIELPLPDATGDWTGAVFGINDAGTVLVQSSTNAGASSIYTVSSSGVRTNLDSELISLTPLGVPEWYRPSNLLNNVGAIAGISAVDGKGVLLEP